MPCCSRSPTRASNSNPGLLGPLSRRCSARPRTVEHGSEDLATVPGSCTASLFGRNPAHADPIGTRMGTFDSDPGVRPSARQFVSYAAPWERIPDDGVPRHPESRHEVT
jgi:hypothetical protein